MPMDIPDEWLNGLRSWASDTHAVRELWVFGSYAKGLARPESDADIAIALMPARGKHDWALGDYAFLKDDWKRQLEAIVGIDVHLYHIEPGTPLDEDARRTGVLLWARDQNP
jgi:predicted nucleotidyltransferase